MLIDTFMSLIPIGCLVLLVCVVGIISILWTDLKGAPYVATPRQTVRQMLELAEVGSQDVVYDLGSGDGRVLWLAAQEFGARAVGVEIDPFRYAWTKLLIRFKRITSASRGHPGRFLQGRLKFCHGGHGLFAARYQPQIDGETGARTASWRRVVSRKYIFPDWDLVQEDPIEELYVYRMRSK